MYGISATFYAILALLAISVTAAPAASGKDFKITDISITGVDSSNTTLSFYVYDDDPLTVNASSAICSGSWLSHSTDYPQGSYKPCGNTTFAWRMETYVDYIFFELGIEHVFTDPSVGAYPYGQAITFGKGNVTADDMICPSIPWNGTTSCTQLANNFISAPIYAITA